MAKHDNVSRIKDKVRFHQKQSFWLKLIVVLQLVTIYLIKII